MAGLTDEGLVIRTQPEIQALLEESMAAAFPGVNVRAGPIQQLIGLVSEQLAEGWETLQAVYAAGTEEASGILLDQIAALTGTKRRAATKSRVTGTVTLTAGTTLPAGSQVAVHDNPDAIFATVEAVSNETASTDDFDVIMESLQTGPVAAPADSLTEIVTPVSGWNAVTNALAAEQGRPRASDDELRLRRRIELAGAGAGPIASIRAALSAIDETVEVQVFENTSETTDGDGRPAKSIEAVIWDGDPSAADDDEIAQAIWNKKAGGILAHGDGESGTAVDDEGAEQTVAFTRATKIEPVVVATVILASGTAAGWEAEAEEAIVAHGEGYTVGETAYASQLVCALLEVPGIVAVPTLTLNGGTSVAATYREIVRFIEANITVTEAP